MKIIDFFDNFLWLLETIFAIIADVFYYYEVINNLKEIKNIEENNDMKTELTNSHNNLRRNSDFKLIDREEIMKKKEFLVIRLSKLKTNRTRIWADLICLIYLYNFNIPRPVAGLFGILGSVAGCLQTLGK